MKKGILWFIGVVFVLGVIGNLTEDNSAKGESETPKANETQGDELGIGSKETVAEIDPADFDYYDMSVEEYMDESTSERKEVAEEFVQFYELPEAVSQDFHACLSYMVRYKSDELPIGHLLGWCKQDYETDPMKLAEEYVDHDKFESNFSAWDGSFVYLKYLKFNCFSSTIFSYIY